MSPVIVKTIKKRSFAAQMPQGIFVKTMLMFNWKSSFEN